MTAEISDPLESAASTPPGQVRHLVLAGMTISVVVAYLARTVLSPASTAIQAELQLSNLQMGAVHGIWAFGYVGFQLPGGWLGDRFGRRAMLPIYGLVWSLCTLWTALSGSFSGLWWSRLVFGGAQAGLVPCLTRACQDWFPEDKRGSASASITAGMSVGAVAASGLAAFLVPWLGWRITCGLFATTGVAWALEFWLTFRDRPEQHPWVGQEELSLIQRPATPRKVPAPGEPTTRAELSTAKLGPSGILTRLGVYGTLAFWMLNGQAICRTFCYNFLTSWFPTYLERGLGLRLQSASLLTMVPLVGVVMGAVAGGWVVDLLLRQTGSKRYSRSAVGFGALILSGLGFFAAIFTSTATAALAILALGAAASGLCSPATWAVSMDLGRGRSTASVMAIANMTGNLGAFLCPLAVGLILDKTSNDWKLVLLMFGAVSSLGALFWLFLDPDELRRRPDDSRTDA